MTIAIVQKREFASGESFARLDAEFVTSPIRQIEQALARLPGARIRDLVKPKLPAFTKRPDSAEFYIDITSVDTQDGLTFPDQIRTEDLPSRAKYRVTSDDILVSNVRPNRGAVSLLSPRSEDQVASSGFTLLRLNNGAPITPAYLFAFLKTTSGREQMVRRNRGSMFPAVTAEDVLDVWITFPDAVTDDTANAHVARALAHQDEFFRLHRTASTHLEDFLAAYGAPPSPLESSRAGVNSHVIPSRSVFGKEAAKRLDAEFFRQDYEEFDKRCRSKGPSFLLGERYQLSPGRSLTAGPKATPYMKQGCLTNVGINWSAVTLERGQRAKGAPRIRAGDILLACTAHEIYYVGRKVDLVRDVPHTLPEAPTCVADLMVIRPRSKDSDSLLGSYVAAFLGHPAGLHQVQRCIRGLRGGHVYKSDLAKYVRVPLPSAEWLSEFESLAQMAERERVSAKSEMRLAFGTVDTYINGLLS